MTSASKHRPYLASGDSAALRECLRPYSGRRCLEIGAGNGGNLKELARNFELVVGTDITLPGTNDWREAGADYVIADAASCFRAGTFDLTAFNPPYVPSDGIVDRAVDGGEDGVEVALHFLEEAVRATRDDGEVLFLLSSENPLGEFVRECSRRGLMVRRILRRQLFYESLHVFVAARGPRRAGNLDRRSAGQNRDRDVLGS